MAKQMSWTDDQGNEYPNSYWKIAQLNVHRIIPPNPSSGMAQSPKKGGVVVFQGWRNKDAADNNALPIPGAQRVYGIGTEEYANYFDSSVLDPLGKDQFAGAYMMADADPNGFFANATDV